MSEMLLFVFQNHAQLVSMNSGWFLSWPHGKKPEKWDIVPVNGLISHEELGPTAAKNQPKLSDLY
jgi:hypothetical protein